MTGSNRRQLRCKLNALPTELIILVFLFFIFYKPGFVEKIQNKKYFFVCLFLWERNFFLPFAIFLALYRVLKKTFFRIFWNTFLTQNNLNCFFSVKLSLKSFLKAVSSCSFLWSPDFPYELYNSYKQPKMKNWFLLEINQILISFEKSKKCSLSDLNR